MVRIAAAGDVHAAPDRRDVLAAAFASLDPDVDLVLLAGDLTTHGEPEQGAILAEAAARSPAPVIAVLGNHDWHVNRRDELVGVLERGSVTVLDRSWTIHEADGLRVGVVGTKGFIGGFPDSQLPDFGEPSLRRVFAETTDEVVALERGLQAIEDCDVRVVLLHYAPTSATLRGEPTTIYTLLGTDRLAEPIHVHRPDIVFHGHAHAGTHEARIGDVPVYNVAVPVMRKDFAVFDLEPARARTT
jgi:Icc-related predicted phosphoesterase